MSTIIRIRPNTIIIELTERSITPLFARIQSSVVIEAEPVDDDRSVYQFIYNDRIWTVSSEDVEVLS